MSQLNSVNLRNTFLKILNNKCCKSMPKLFHPFTCVQYMQYFSFLYNPAMLSKLTCSQNVSVLDKFVLHLCSEICQPQEVSGLRPLGTVCILTSINCHLQKIDMHNYYYYYVNYYVSFNIYPSVCFRYPFIY